MIEQTAEEIAESMIKDPLAWANFIIKVSAELEWQVRLVEMLVNDKESDDV